LPWCAYLVAILIFRFRRIPRALGAATGALLLTAAMLASMQGAHGQLSVDRFTTNEIVGSKWLYDHAQPGAAIVLATSDFPSPYTPNYGNFKPGRNGVGELIKAAQMAHLKLNAADLPAVEAYARGLAGTTSYLVISRSMRVYAHYFGYLFDKDHALDNLQAACAASPRWKLFYSNPDVVIYQLVAPAPPTQ
jgi:hypothetical protein